MKKYKIILVALMALSATSCSNRAYPKFDYNNGPNPWINAFKDQVFYNILDNAYKSDTIFNLIAKKDGLIVYDQFTLNSLKKTRELAKNLVKNMPAAVLCDECKDGQKYYMVNALHYYRSRELDSIARKEYKNYLKEQKASDKAAEEYYKKK